MGCCGSNGNGTGDPPPGSIDRVQKSRRRICESCPSGEYDGDGCRVLGVDVRVVTLSAHDCPRGWFTEETAGRSLPEMRRAVDRCEDCEFRRSENNEIAKCPPGQHLQRAGRGSPARSSCTQMAGDLVRFRRELSVGSCPIGRWPANPRAGDPLIYAGDLTGAPPVSGDLATRRLSVCNGCEHRTAPGLHVQLAAWIMRLPFLRRWRPDNLSMCARCKCWIELKVRAKWSRCPIGKW